MLLVLDEIACTCFSNMWVWINKVLISSGGLAKTTIYIYIYIYPVDTWLRCKLQIWQHMVYQNWKQPVLVCVATCISLEGYQNWQDGLAQKLALNEKALPFLSSIIIWH